jgi:single-strand DNA-binding protein
MFTYSQTQLIGRLGNDPDTKTSAGGSAYSKFSVATERSSKDKSGEWVKTTVWHNCTAFGKIAEMIDRNLKKGSRVHVVGEYVYDENDGKKYYQVLVSNITLLDRVEKTEGSSAPAAASAAKSAGSSKSQPAETLTEEDIPF